MQKSKEEDSILKKIEKFAEKKFTDEMIETTNAVVKKYGLKLNENGNAIDCEADAFRHAYMQWWLSFRFGSNIAKHFGDKHEHGNNPDVRRDTNMDLWNNQIGRELAEEMSEKYGSDIVVYDLDWFDEIATKKIVEKIRNGELITNPNDKRNYKNMELERLKHEDKIYSKEEYESLIGEEKDEATKNFIDYVIDHDWKIPRKADLEKQVKSGELIYVDNYTRSDGTKVSGYYRRRTYYKNHKN